MTKQAGQDEIRWILIGEIVAAQGNRGEVRVLPHTDFPERFANMDHVRLFWHGVDEPDHSRDVEGCRYHKQFVILKLAGIDGIDQAEALRGMEIRVARNEVVEMPPGQYYYFELLGLNVETCQGIELGVVTDVLHTGANDVYVVRPKKGITKNKEILLPVIDDVVKTVDLAAKRIVVQLLEGLLD